MRKIHVAHIDSDVPIPEERITKADLLPIENLMVGDSMEFPSEFREYVQSKASKLKRYKGMAYTVRKVSPDACRVWRTA